MLVMIRKRFVARRKDHDLQLRKASLPRRFAGAPENFVLNFERRRGVFHTEALKQMPSLLYLNLPLHALAIK